jgi:hypothetical protein
VFETAAMQKSTRIMRLLESHSHIPKLGMVGWRLALNKLLNNSAHWSISHPIKTHFTQTQNPQSKWACKVEAIC